LVQILKEYDTSLIVVQFRSHVDLAASKPAQGMFHLTPINFTPNSN
jgi:hypothetical protein